MNGNPVAYYAPQGFMGGWDDAGKATGVQSSGGSSGGYTSFRTFLACDFRPTGGDAGTYPPFTTDNHCQPSRKVGSQSSSSTTSNTPAFGPSSGHPTTVNHLMGDGSVQGLSKQIDVSAYMFMITKAGNDPNPPAP